MVPMIRRLDSFAGYKEQRREEDASRVKIMREPGRRDVDGENRSRKQRAFPVSRCALAGATLRHIWYHFFAISSPCWLTEFIGVQRGT